MEDQIKQIAERLKGMREVLEISVEEAAMTCGIKMQEYLKYETG